jgi:hypothetical protein
MTAMMTKTTTIVVLCSITLTMTCTVISMNERTVMKSDIKSDIKAVNNINEVVVGDKLTVDEVVEDNKYDERNNSVESTSSVYMANTSCDGDKLRRVEDDVDKREMIDTEDNLYVLDSGCKGAHLLDLELDEHLLDSKEDNQSEVQSYSGHTLTATHNGKLPGVHDGKALCIIPKPIC